MRISGPLRWLLPLAFLGTLLGCEEEVKEDQPEQIVGALELPISKRSADQRPENPLRIEASAEELRLDGRKVLDLESGLVAESERRDDLLPKLESAIEAGGSRKAAALRLYVNTPYETTVAVLNTLGELGVGQVAFEVRKGNGKETGWMVPEEIRIRSFTDDPVEFSSRFQRQWDEFGKKWDAVYGACMKKHAVDCDGKAFNIAEGGDMEITLQARGRGLKVALERFGVSEDGGVDEEDEGESKGRVAMIPGVPVADQGQEEDEDEPPPDTDAAFTWKFPAATEKESPISLALRPICGAQPCGAVVTSQYRTPTMRSLAFIGAAFPDGAPAPSLVFFRPRR